MPRAQAGRGPGGSERSVNRAVGCSLGPELQLESLDWGGGRELERETPPGPLLQVGACGWSGWQGAVRVPGTSILQSQAGPSTWPFCPRSHLPGSLAV